MSEEIINAEEVVVTEEAVVVPVGEQVVETVTEFTNEQINYIEANELTIAQVRELLGLTNEPMTLDAAIGGVKNKVAIEVSGEAVAGTQPE